jgi:hypothetical protein
MTFSMALVVEKKRRRAVLHFELYANTLSAPLSGHYQNPFKRRVDLLDQTPLLNRS